MLSAYQAELSFVCLRFVVSRLIMCFCLDSIFVQSIIYYYLSYYFTRGKSLRVASRRVAWRLRLPGRRPAGREAGARLGHLRQLLRGAALLRPLGRPFGPGTGSLGPFGSSDSFWTAGDARSAVLHVRQRVMRCVMHDACL